MKENTHLLVYMEIFIEVVDSGSFSAAARRMEISQPSVSRQISALEAALGVRLLQRTTRRLSLTEAGEIYYRQSRKIQRDIIEAGNSISAFKESASGLLKIGAPIGWTEIKIAPHLSEFLQAYPDIELDIQSTDDVQDVVEERLDLVLRVGVLNDSSYVARPLGKAELVLCASPQYFAQYGRPAVPTELSAHNCIMFDHNNQWTFKIGKSEQVVHVKGKVNTHMVSVMISMCEQHMGIMLLPVQLLRKQLSSGLLEQVFENHDISYTQLNDMEVFVLYSNRKHLPAKVKAFMDFFKDKI